MQKINKELVQYVVQLMEKQVTKEQIKNQLVSVGWSEDEAEEVYSQVLITQGIPVPSEAMRSTSEKKSSTLEVVINLFSFILLGIVATSLGVLLYQIIDKYFPDALINMSSYRYGVSTRSIHYAIASLIVAFPVYYFSLHMWFLGFQKDERKVETKLTKLLTYLVLFIVSIMIVGDLIITVYTFLQGELAIRFFLKALTILVIAGTIFGFYFLERRKIQYRKPVKEKVFKIFGWTTTVVILLAVVIGFIAGGSPAKERKRGFDQQRIKDLNSLAICVKNYANKYQRLPSSLSELQKITSYTYCANKKDPETKKDYIYRVISNSRVKGFVREGDFELCANFSLKAEDEGEYRNKNMNIIYMAVTQGLWKNHSAGQSCNQMTVKLGNVKNNVPASGNNSSMIINQLKK